MRDTSTNPYSPDDLLVWSHERPHDPPETCRSMMINCTECGKEYSDQAKACVHCGAPNVAKSGGCLKAAIGLVVMVVLFAIFVIALRAYTLDPQEMIDSEAIKECRNTENDELLSIEARRLARDACDLMEKRYNEKYGHAP